MIYTFQRIVSYEEFQEIEADSLEEALELAKTDDVKYGEWDREPDSFGIDSYKLYSDEEDIIDIVLDPNTGDVQE